MHENKLLYLLTHLCIFLLNKKLLFGEALCYLEDPTLLHWSPCFSVLPKLLVWHYTTQRSGHQVQHQCYLRGAMPRQWSPGDLPGVLRIWESIFDSQAFFTVQSFLFFFSRLPWGQQFNRKVSRVSYWSSKHRPSPTICLKSFMSYVLFKS